MTKTDTDSQMMRDQQDRDTPQHMARDGEKHPAERSDLDAQSKAEREQAKSGTFTLQPFTEQCSSRCPPPATLAVLARTRRAQADPSQPQSPAQN